MSVNKYFMFNDQENKKKRSQNQNRQILYISEKKFSNRQKKNI